MGLRVIGGRMVDGDVLPLPVMNFDPNQPRDDEGQWTDEGGGSGNGGAAPTTEGVKEGDTPAAEKAVAMSTTAQWAPKNSAKDVYDEAKSRWGVYVKAKTPSPSVLKRLNAVGETLASLENLEESVFGRRGEGLPGMIRIDPKNSIISKTSGRVLNGAYNSDSDLVRIDGGLKSVETPPTIGKKYFLVGNTTQAVIRHEIGHKALNRPIFGPVHSALSRIGEKEWGSISQYAKTSHSEAFCESFAAYTNPLYKRGTLPADVEKAFDGIFRKGG